MKIPFFSRFFGGGKNEDDVKKRFSNLGEKIKLERENEELRQEIADLRSKRNYIDIDIGDPDKREMEDRKAYVSKVAEIHDNVLLPKLKLMSSVVRQDAMNENLPNEHIRMLQGADYALHELIRWGKKMKSESLSYQQEGN